MLDETYKLNFYVVKLGQSEKIGADDKVWRKFYNLPYHK